MKQVEVIPISHTCDVAVETPAAEKAGLEVVNGGNAAEVGFVEADEGEGCARCQ